MRWTTQQDEDLRLLGLKNDREAALRLQYQWDVDVTEDMVRNRRKRLGEPYVEPLPEALPVPPGVDVNFRLGFWDTESTGLTAIMGRLICAVVGDSRGELQTRTIFDFPQKTKLDDSGLCEWLRDTLESFDVLVAWNGAMHDTPLLNARLLLHGKRIMADRMAIDPMWKARGGRYGARIGSSKLVNVQKYFRHQGVSSEKSDIDWDVWALAGMGDQDAMAEIVDHCQKDVHVLRQVFAQLRPLVRSIHK